MGLDIEYQALPEGCSLLEWARQQPEFGSYLEFFQRYASSTPQQLSHRSHEENFAEFVAQARKIVDEHPNTAQRNFSLGRRWDWIYYLLSDRRRRSEAKDWSNWVEKAIFGGEILNPGTQTTIGVPIRYLRPLQVAEVARKLEAFDVHQLRSHWNPRQMSEASVYKMNPEADDENFRYVEEDVEALKRFYLEVVEHQEGVLTFIS